MSLLQIEMRGQHDSASDYHIWIYLTQAHISFGQVGSQVESMLTIIMTDFITTHVGAHRVIFNSWSKRQVSSSNGGK